MTEETDNFDYNEVFRSEDGSGMFALSFGDDEMASSFENKLSSKQAQPTSDGSIVTPTGDSEGQKVSDETGPVTRINETGTHLGSVGMEVLALRNYEVSKAINRLVDETYRQNFPILQPAGEGSSEVERRRAEEQFRSINNAGQSFHGLMKMVTQDHARLGTGMIIIRKSYAQMDGQIVNESVDELVRGDPKVVRPVTDEKNQVGGLYACPIHRDDVTDEPGACDECEVPRRQVTYAKTKNPKGDNITDVFFDDEVISFSFYNTRLHGRDALSPVGGVWKQAYILDQMRNYVGKYFDDSTGNRYPDKLLFVTTSNADAFAKQAEQAKDNRQESPYEEGILFFENTELDVQSVDMMSTEIMGQSETIKADYKSDIRSAFGLTDVIDSDEDSASMASGSKGVDVMSRSIQALRTDLEREVMPEIEEALDLDDWNLTFKKEDSEEEVASIGEQAEAIQALTESNQPYRIEDGEVTLVDSDDELDEESEQTEDVDTSEE